MICWCFLYVAPSLAVSYYRQVVVDELPDLTVVQVTTGLGYGFHGVDVPQLYALAAGDEKNPISAIASIAVFMLSLSVSKCVIISIRLRYFLRHIDCVLIIEQGISDVLPKRANPSTQAQKSTIELCL